MRVPLVPRLRVVNETLPAALFMLTPVFPTPPPVEPAVTVVMLVVPITQLAGGLHPFPAARGRRIGGVVREKAKAR